MNEDIASSLANLAAILGAYYLQLLEHGFPTYMAFELVRDFQRLHLERQLKNKSDEPNAPKENVGRD